jgi:hypothetical protein
MTVLGHASGPNEAPSAMPTWSVQVSMASLPFLLGRLYTAVLGPPGRGVQTHLATTAELGS